ncbi:hypothetical protein GCM10010435_43030 [Winogradskya consettensis]|uniref:Uncharacterized protein n=1 Tax=Winogradskya consettensis TaxID=113560 RepID=A0A919T3F9_9ACTN|nr:hypothetical protein [Actinoplanes consettensis]GIM83501.1 hypothetical protein Aco04nite_86830 [Actinoplanes consettensis]
MIDAPVAAQLHLLLLRAAGRLPDDTVADLRFTLADGRFEMCAAALVDAFDMTADEIAVLAAVLPAGTALPAPVDGPADPTPATPFIPVPPDALEMYQGFVPPLLDVSGDDDQTDVYDDIVLEALDPSETSGVWRGWRVRDDSFTRIYVVESDVAPEELPGVAAAARQALIDAGDLTSQVEVYRGDMPLPAYQWAARAGSALIWAPYPTPEIRFAELEGPGSAPLDGDERAAALEYLREATLMTPGVRTDGRWVWPDAIADRLADQGVLGDPALLEHLRETGYLLWQADAVAVHRALAALQRVGAGTVVDDE